MNATATERQPLTHYIGGAVTDPKETKNGGATKFRFAQSDGFGEDKNTTFFDVVATKDELRASINKHVTEGTQLAITGNLKSEDYNGKTYFTIFPVVIAVAKNIKLLPDPDEF